MCRTSYSIHSRSTGERLGHCDTSKEIFFFLYKYIFFFPIFFINFSTSEKLGGISGQRWTPSCLTSWAARSCSRRRRRRWKWAAEIIWRSSTASIRTSSPAARPSETTRPSGTGGAGTSSFLSLSLIARVWLVLKCGWNGAWGFFVCVVFLMRCAVVLLSGLLWLSLHLHQSSDRASLVRLLKNK